MKINSDLIGKEVIDDSGDQVGDGIPDQIM